MAGARAIDGRQVALLVAAAWVLSLLAAGAGGQIVGPSRSDRPAGNRPPAAAPRPPAQQQQRPPPTNTPVATTAPATSPSAMLVFNHPGMSLLLRRPTKFTDERIALALTRASGEKFAYSARGPNYFVTSRFANTWDVAYGDLHFEIFAGELLPLAERKWPGPGPEAPEERWAYQNASGEVRVIWSDPDASEDRARRAARFVGSVLADLINDDCLAVMRFEGETLAIEPRTAVTARELRSPRPSLATEGLSNEPPPADRDRPRLDEAQAQARATWPVFVEALGSRRPEDVLAVHAVPGGGGGRGGGAATGGEPRYLLAESPSSDGGVRARPPGGGAAVQVAPGEVVDWVLCREGRFEGRFYVTAARELRLERVERGER